MKRTAMFVDAGYFFAGGAQLITSQQKTPRCNIALIDTHAVVAALGAVAGDITGNPLLRIYWYDAMRGPRMGPEQIALALEDTLKMRLGTLNGLGEQKGVDNLLVTDLIDLSRNRAIADAVILTGDEDLRIAVTVAQSFGVRVHLLGIDPIERNMSLALRMDADSVRSLDEAWIKTHLAVDFGEAASDVMEGVGIERPATAPAEVRISPAQAKMAVGPDAEHPPELAVVANPIIREFVASLPDDRRRQLVEHFEYSTTVPPEYDRVVIKQVSTAMQKVFASKELREIRGMLIAEVRYT